MIATNATKLYAQRVAVMFCIAVPTVAIGVGFYDWGLADARVSLLDAIISSLTFGYIVVGPWLLVTSLLHTMLTRERTSAVMSFSAATALGAGAGLLAGQLFGYQLAAGGWRLPVICGLIGALYGLIVNVTSKASERATR